MAGRREGINTAICRFTVLCKGQLIIESLTDGQFQDREFVYRVRDSAGQERVGLIGGGDTVLLDRLSPGVAEVRLASFRHSGGPEEEALAHVTIWPAYAAFQDSVLGSITPGKLADLVVLSQDIMTAPPGTNSRNGGQGDDRPRARHVRTEMRPR